MKIAHVTLVHPRYDIRIFQKYCRSLRKSSYPDVVLLVADGEGDGCQHGVHIYDVATPTRFRLWRAFRGSVRVWRCLRRLAPSIVHVHDPELLPLATAWRLQGGLVVYDMHENLPAEILTKAWIPRPMRGVASKLALLLQRKILREIPTVFAEDSYAVDFPSVRQSVIVRNFPVLEELMEIGVPKRRAFTVGYSGGLSAERGLAQMIAAIEDVRGTGRDVRALFVGPIDPKDRPLLLAPNGRRRTWIETTGRVTPETSWRLMASCHVGLAVLLPSPNFVQSYPTKLFEYMVLGLPVIVSDIPLWCDIVEDAKCGFTARPDEPDEIARKLLWFFDHRSEAVDLGRRGKEFAVPRFSWIAEFAVALRFYEEIAACAGPEVRRIGRLRAWLAEFIR